MCGIAGILDSHNPPHEDEIVRMRDLMDYRGPDDCGLLILATDGLGLGHRRLSIFDTSSSGRQPMSDVDRKLHIVFNGEIFNFIEIREELRGKGYEFHTGTDTEVLLASYDCWGESCLQRFIGMFAFALWDGKRKRLFIARDRLGIKPFYYCFDGKRLVFASEVKSIVAVMGNIKSVNTELIDTYMSFGYIPGEDTLLQGVKRLLPGHYGIISDGNFTLSQYWDLKFDNHEDQGLEYYLRGTTELLEDSVKLRLRSDVPFGVFLSGGLDSSAVVSLVSPMVNRGLKTFSVRYDFGAEYDETPYARTIAAKFGTDHHEFTITPKEFMDLVPRYIHIMDEPVAEAAAISLYCISRFAKEHVTVTLSGEGSDEIFAGYGFYKHNLFMEKFGVVAGRLFGGKLFTRIAASRSRKLAKYLDLCNKLLETRYKGISTYDETVKGGLYTPEFKEFGRKTCDNSAQRYIASLFASTSNLDPLSRMLYFDTKTWLVDDLLIKADRMSMAASVELRVPFLDHRLVEFAARTPSCYKIENGRTKSILKKIMKGRLPESIIHRKKMGFPTPLEIMFRKDLFGYVSDILLSSSAIGRGYFRRDFVEGMLTRHRKNEASYHRELWQLLVLENWHRQNT
jgi:asparagine synthase (glutamine-hydrolysing)